MFDLCFTLKYYRFTNVFGVNSNALFTFRALQLENSGVFESENIFTLLNELQPCISCGQSVYKKNEPKK